MGDSLYALRHRPAKQIGLALRDIQQNINGLHLPVPRPVYPIL